MTTVALQTPLIGYLIAKGIQITIEEFFPPLRQNECFDLARGQPYIHTLRPGNLPSRYDSSKGFWCEERKKLRYLYERKISWKNRGGFRSFVGSTFPLSTFLILFYEKDPSPFKEPLIAKIFFYCMIAGGGIHFAQLGVYYTIKAISTPFPESIQRVIKRATNIIEPAKVIFECELEQNGKPVRDFLLCPESAPPQYV